MTSQLTEDILESYRTEKMLAEQVNALQAQVAALQNKLGKALTALDADLTHIQALKAERDAARKSLEIQTVCARSYKQMLDELKNATLYLVKQLNDKGVAHLSEEDMTLLTAALQAAQLTPPEGGEGTVK